MAAVKGDGRRDGKEAIITFLKVKRPLPEINVCYANHELKDEYDYIVVMIISSLSPLDHSFSLVLRRRQLSTRLTPTSINPKSTISNNFFNSTTFGAYFTDLPFIFA